MTITIQSVLEKTAIDLQELNIAGSPDITFPSGIWNQTEMIGYVNYVEVDFLRRTSILKMDSSIAVVGLIFYPYHPLTGFFGWAEYVPHAPLAPPSYGTPLVILGPTKRMDLDRVSFDKKRLLRQSSWDMSLENSRWRNQPAGQPRYYHEDLLPFYTIEVDRIPIAGGIVRFFYGLLPTPKTLITDILEIPDAWEQYLRWGVLSLALSRDGDGQDLARAKLAHDRYMFGVRLAIRLVLGDIDEPIEAME